MAEISSTETAQVKIILSTTACWRRASARRGNKESNVAPMALDVTLVVMVKVLLVVVTAVTVVLGPVIAVVMATVVMRGLLCAGAFIGALVKYLTGVTRVDALVILSNASVDILMDALAGAIRRDVRNENDIGVLADTNGNVFAGMMTAFELANSGPLEDFR